MNEPQPNNDRRNVMVTNVINNAKSQATSENRMNYFRSCEAHGGELATIAAEIKSSLFCDLCGNNKSNNGLCIDDNCLNGTNE